MTRRFASSALTIILLSLAGARSAPASCGSDHCPFDMGGEFGAGRLTFDLSYQYIDQDRVQVGTHRASVGELPSPEDEVRTRNEMFSARGAFRLNDRFRLSAEIPWVKRLHEHIANEENQEPEDLTFRYSGLGDLTVLGMWTLTASGAPVSLSLEAGGRAPTGRTHVDPVEGNEPEPSALPGTGAWSGLAGFHLMKMVRVRTLSRESAMTPFFAGLLYRMNGVGTEDYRIGNELEGSAGGSYPMSRGVELLVQMNARFRAKDDTGVTDALPDNTGGTWLFLSPGLRVHPAGALSVYSYFQVPVYQKVNRIGLVAPYRVMGGLSFTPGH